MTSETSSATGIGVPTVAVSVPARPVRRSRAAAVRAVLSQTLLSLIALLFLLPIIWMVLSALKPSAEVFTVPPKPLGSKIMLSNFADAWNYLPFGRFILNTVFVAAVGTAITLVASALSGYAFARLNFPFRGGLFVMYLSTLIVPQEVIVIPMFLIMKQLGWVNSYQALILPWAFTAFGTFLLRQFFLTIPRELEEAATIDGASRIRILLQVVMPIARPAIAVLAAFTFINYWNSFLWPLIVINDPDLATLPLGLQMFSGERGTDWGPLMAAATLAVVPSLLIVLAMQKQLAKGINLGGFGGR